MHSTFFISKSTCMTCTNKTLKSLGTLQGVFGAEIDQVNAVVTVEHTDEISRMEISEILQTLGYPEIKGDELPEINYDDPSIWGCAL